MSCIEKANSLGKAAVTELIAKAGIYEYGTVSENFADKMAAVKAAYVAEGHKADSIKNIEVYIKLSENMAYYVIDGYASGISLY